MQQEAIMADDSARDKLALDRGEVPKRIFHPYHSRSPAQAHCGGATYALTERTRGGWLLFVFPWSL